MNRMHPPATTAVARRPAARPLLHGKARLATGPRPPAAGCPRPPVLPSQPGRAAKAARAAPPEPRKQPPPCALGANANGSALVQHRNAAAEAIGHHTRTRKPVPLGDCACSRSLLQLSYGGIVRLMHRPSRQHTNPTTTLCHSHTDECAFMCACYPSSQRSRLHRRRHHRPCSPVCIPATLRTGFTAVDFTSRSKEMQRQVPPGTGPAPTQRSRAPQAWLWWSSHPSPPTQGK